MGGNRRVKRKEKKKVIGATKLKGLWSHMLPSNGKVAVKIQIPRRNIVFNIKLNHSDDDVRAVQKVYTQP
jgi:hypothetical protein